MAVRDANSDPAPRVGRHMVETFGLKSTKLTIRCQISCQMTMEEALAASTINAAAAIAVADEVGSIEVLQVAF